jgi:S-adenosylmethionine hydrolase
VRAFATVDPGEVGLIVDAYGLYAVVLDRASAADEFELRAGSAVTIEALDEQRQPGIVTPVTISPRPV